MGSLLYSTMRSMMRVAVGRTFPVRSIGADCIPSSGGVIVVANHQSFLDPIVLGITIQRHASFLARASLMRRPPMKWILEGVHAIPIERDGVGKEGIKRCVRCLEEGQVVVLFPEGTRTLDGKLAPLKPGIRLLLRRTKAPVVVAGISGSFESWPRDRLLPRPRPIWIHYQSWESSISGDADVLASLEGAISEVFTAAERSRHGQVPQKDKYSA